MKDARKANGALVEALGSALREGEHGLSTAPALLLRVLREESWRDFVTQRGDEANPGDFDEFALTPPLKGLGVKPRLVDKVADAIEDKALRAEVQSLLTQARRRPPSVHALNNIQSTKAPQGTSKDAALRRLRKDAPELHSEVLAGNLSAHAAMVKAGFRPKTFTVRPDPASAARTLRKHMTADDLKALARLLLDEEGA